MTDCRIQFATRHCELLRSNPVPWGKETHEKIHGLQYPWKNPNIYIYILQVFLINFGDMVEEWGWLDWLVELES